VSVLFCATAQLHKLIASADLLLLLLLLLLKMMMYKCLSAAGSKFEPEKCYS
jgi:hypothetical protein